jgi:type IV secretion system T-DNA border endonuclease VirD2
MRTASRLNSSLCIAAIFGLLDGEYRSQKTGTKPVQVQIRRELRLEGLTEEQIEDWEWEVISRAEWRIETQQRDWLAAHPDLLARPGNVIDRSEPYRERITDETRAGEIAREVDRIMVGREVRTPVAEAVTGEFRARYPDMPSHLARGLGATYAAVVEIRDTAAIERVRRESELRDRLGTETKDSGVSTGQEGALRVRGDARLADEIARVIENEREGHAAAPFAEPDQRVSYRAAVERELDRAQIDRLRAGDADVLKDRIPDRLDRLYAAKVYLQSDVATASSAATRAVVEEIADREFERNHGTMIDGDSERGETH